VGDAPEIRVSDAEREAAADRLRRASGEGRLDPDELEERLARAYSARTTGELAQLTRDLPEPAPPQPSRGEVVRRGAWARRSLLFPPLVCTLIWLAAGAHPPFWPIWVFLGCGIAALATVLGVGRAERHDERRDARDARRGARREARASRRDRRLPPPPAPPGQ